MSLVNRTKLTISAIALTALIGNGYAVAGELSGEVGIQTQLFLEDSLDPRQDEFGLSTFAEVEFFQDWDDGSQRFAATAFFRADEDDSERTHFDFRELYYRKTFDTQRLDLYVGARKVFWGVTESLHLVDVINQTDLVENIDTEDKLGQPMVQLVWEKPWGTLEAFYLPYFRERTFPGANGRLRTPLVVDTDNAVYESSAEEWRQDFALRYSHSFDAFDVGIAHFSGTSREPRLVPTTNGGETVLTPHYDVLDQTSLDLQYTGEAWLWKLEAVTRDSFDGRSNAFVGGFEYTFFGVKDTAIDLGIVAEYQYDDRSGDPLNGSIQPLGDNDIAIGGRITLNDTNDTDILAVATVDTETGSQLFTIEADRRVGSNWEIEFQARFFATDTDESDPLVFFEREDHFQLTLRRFF